MSNPVTLTPCTSLHPRYASVHDALAASVPLLNELIREGRAIRERQGADDTQHLYSTPAPDPSGELSVKWA